jgi:F0F1-type ATP synthase membrane subunit b/b'
MLVLAVAGLAACTKEDTDFAKHKLEKAKEEIKQDANKAGAEVKHDASELRQKVRKEVDKPAR